MQNQERRCGAMSVELLESKEVKKAIEVLKKIGREKEIEDFKKLLEKGFRVYYCSTDSVELLPARVVENEYDYYGWYCRIEIYKDKVLCICGYWIYGSCDEVMEETYKTIAEVLN